MLRLRSDEQLVSLFRAGNDEAFRAIHDRYRARMLGYTRQMLAGCQPALLPELKQQLLRQQTTGALRALLEGWGRAPGGEGEIYAT